MSEECCACGSTFDEDDEDDEKVKVTHITHTREISKVKNGDVICSTCFMENLCLRCGFNKKTNHYGSFHCKTCERPILGDCDCVAVAWCQSHEVICRDCILKESEDRWRCEECNSDLREDLSIDLSLCEDAQSLLCAECM